MHIVKVNDTVRYRCVYTEGIPDISVTTAKIIDLSETHPTPPSKRGFQIFRVSAKDDPRGQDWHPVDEIVEIVNES